MTSIFFQVDFSLSVGGNCRKEQERQTGTETGTEAGP